MEKSSGSRGLWSTPRFLFALLLSLSCTAIFYEVFSLSRPSIRPPQLSSFRESRLFTAEHSAQDPLLRGEDENDVEGGPRIRQATMMYPNNLDPVYERALNTHVKHGHLWDTPTHILRYNLLEEKIYNKPAYLLALICDELAKPTGRRAEWVFWFDADTVVINPSIPLDAFLPPSDLLSKIHFLGTKDWNGYNAGVFFIRVDAWSVRMLSEVVALPLLKPDLDYTFLEQSAMAYAFEKPNYRENVLYQPRGWFNAYSRGEEDNTDPEVQRGDLQLHFPGLSGKDQLMSLWLDRVEQTPEDWKVSFQNTTYPKQIKRYWSRIQSAEKLLRQAEDTITENSEDESLVSKLKKKRAQLKKVMEEEAFDDEVMDREMKSLKKTINHTVSEAEPGSSHE